MLDKDKSTRDATTEPAVLVSKQKLVVFEGNSSPAPLPSLCMTDKKTAVVQVLPLPTTALPHDHETQPPTVANPNALRNPATDSSQVHLLEYKRSLKTRQQCIIATFVGAFLSLSCFVAGLVIALRDPYNLALRLPIPIQNNWNEAISLGINLIIGFVNDSMAFVDSCSLCWALLAEERLEYNTNIRLFTHARVSPPNHWPANVLSMASLVLCYGASSLVIVGGEPEDRDRDIQCWDLGFQVESEYTWVNATAFCALGVGLGVQATLAAWCLYLSTSTKGKVTGSTVPSWDSDPLSATLAALHLGIITRRQGRAMLSVHQHDEPSGAAHPLPRPKSMWALRQRSIRVVLILVWTGDEPNYGNHHKNFMEFSMSPTDLSNVLGEAMIPYFWECFLGVIYLCFIQGTQTCGLHAVELVVNMSRDEAAWRRASSTSGVKPAGSDESLVAAVKSWENGVLFVAKAVLHWITREAVMPTLNPTKGKFWLCVAYSRFFVYAMLAISTAIFTTWIATRGYRGPQPAAFGNVQTLADLINDWRTDDKGRFWWGDKTPREEDRNVARHARTASRKEDLGVVSLDWRYL